MDFSTKKRPRRDDHSVGFYDFPIFFKQTNITSSFQSLALIQSATHNPAQKLYQV